MGTSRHAPAGIGPRPVAVHHLFEAQAAQRPDAVALVDGEELCSYGHLDRQANRLARALRRRGVGPEAVVGLLLPRSAAMVRATLAVVKAGGAYLPLDPAYPGSRLEWMAEDAGLALLLTDGSGPAPGPGALPCPAVPLSQVEAEARGEEQDGLAGHLAPELALYVMYTSGSTGQPKGIVVPHRGVLRLVLGKGHARLGPDQVLLQLAATSFDAATLEIWGALARGGRLVLPPPEAPTLEEIAAMVRRHRVTLLWLTAGLFHPMVDGPVDGLRGLRQLLAGGDVLSADHVRRALEALPETLLTNGYGPTENTTFTCCCSLRRGDRVGSSVPIGRPIEGSRAHLLDPALRPVPPGDEGELYAGGQGLARGYHRRPGLTAQRFLPAPFATTPGERLYRTGDRVRLGPGDELEFLGRVDRQVKVRGFRVEPGEVEAALASHPEVREAAVVAPRDRAGDRSLVAYAVLRPEASATAGELKGWLGQTLPSELVPSLVVLLPHLPLTPNGKVDRRALEARGRPAPPAEPGGKAVTASSEEGLIAAVWAQVLEVEGVGREQSLLELGGHSLHAARILFQINRLFGVQLSLPDLFEAPTVAALAARVAGARTSRGAPPLTPGPRQEDPPPLSFAQERIWFLDQLSPGSPHYNVPVAWRLRGPLHHRALAASLAEIVRRHQVLRTAYPARDDRPVQRISPATGPGLPVVDLSRLPSGRAAGELRERVRGAALRPFDLATGPVIRASLLRLSGAEAVLLLSFHHIAVDDASVEVLARELGALYPLWSRQPGAPSPLADPPVQYADFALWERRRLQGEVLAEHLAYWRRRLSGASACELPADRPRPREPSFRGGEVGFALSPALTRALAALGRERGATLFMTLLAALQALLHRLTGQRDVVVGAAVANRNQAEVEELIGFFVNTLPLRCEVEADPPFAAFLPRVARATLEAYGHQELPFERLVEELHPERVPGRNPLFQVSLNLVTSPTLIFAAGDLEVEPYRLVEQTARLDVEVHLHPNGDGLAGGIVYSRDLYDGTTLERFARHFAHLLAEAVQDPERRLSRMALLSSPERQQLVVEWNPPSPPEPEGSLYCLFRHQAETRPEAAAVSWGDELLSYGELDRRARRLGWVLRRLGVGTDARVGLCLERGPALIWAIVGSLAAGGAYLPLDPTYPEARLATLLADGDPVVLLTDRPLPPSFPVGGRPVLELSADGRSFSSLPEDGAPPETLPSPGGGEELAYVLFTSGSTGAPKGVAVSQRAVRLLVLGDDDLRLSPAHRVLQASNASFDAATFEIWGCLLAGACLVGCDRGTLLSPPDFARWMAERRVTTLFLVVALLNQLVQEAPSAFREAGHLLFGGEAPDLRRVREILAHGSPRCRHLHVYGPTETTTFATWSPVREVPPGAATIAIGRPLAYTAARVLDRRLRQLPVTAPGELCLGGPRLARGYLGRPAATAERFVPDPFAGEAGQRLYRTGDLVRRLPDGELLFLSRIDHQVKVRGFRIEPGEVEAALADHPAVAQAVVLAPAVPSGGRRLVAWVLPAPGRRADLRELHSFLAGRLPDPMIPSLLLPIGELPLTATGKVDRRALGERALTAVAPAGEGEEEEAPVTELEEALAQIWAALLGRERVGRHASFFELGGHSLLATRVVARVRRLLGLDLPVAALFQTPTVAALARRLDRLAGTGGPPPIEPAARGGELPLSSPQQRLWLQDRLAPGNPFYNVPVAWRLTGPLEVPALAAALAALVRRHEPLRTRFPRRPDGPCQVISPAPRRWPLPVVDLARLGGSARELGERLVRHAGQVPFDLARGPVLRALLLRCAEGEWLLLLSVHHIAVDDASLAIVARELEALYRAGPAPGSAAAGLPALPVQYGDFTLWEHRWLAGDALAGHLAYWRRRLAGAPATELPADRPRPPVSSFRGGAVIFTLPDPLARAIEALGRGRGASPFMTLLAAFQTLLHRFTGDREVVVGTAVANRHRPEIEELVGFFVNLLPLRGDLAGNPPFSDLLTRVVQAVLADLRHQELPFDRLVEGLRPQRDATRNPFFQVVFNLVTTPGLTLTLGPVRGQALEVEEPTARVDLELHLHRTPEGFRGKLVYRRDLFDATSAHRLAAALQQLLAGVAGDPSRRLSELPLLSPTQVHQLVREWSPPAEAGSDAGLASLVHAQVQARPEAPAVVWGDHHLGYRELARRARRLALLLRRRGLEPDQRVAVYLPRSAALIWSWLGILEAGGAYLPLDLDQPEARLAVMLAEGAPPVLLTDRPLPATLATGGSEVLSLEPGGAAFAGAPPLPTAETPAEGPPAPAPALADQLAYVLYTSGSTGRPKGVAVPQRAVRHLVRGTSSPPFHPGDRVGQLSNGAFDAATLEIWGALAHGACLVGVETAVLLSPPAFTRFVRERRLTILVLTAALFNQLARESPETFAGVSYLSSGGEATDPESLRRLLACPAFLGRPAQAYGPTEATTLATWQWLRDLPPDATALPIGRPVQAATALLLDRRLRPVPLGMPGEIALGGWRLARGYLSRPGQTAERFVPDPWSGGAGMRLFRTGDLGRQLPGGELVFLGRLDHQVKIRGFRVEPGEIEVVLAAHPSVRQAVVTAPAETGGTRRLVAYVVPAAEGDLDVQKLCRHLADRLPEVMVPQRFIRLEELPLTATGKVDRRRLPVPETADAETAVSPFVAPRNELEERLAAIFREVLGIHRVGVHDDFFDLGGHSLNATQVLSRLDRRLGVELPLATLFQRSTVATLAEEVEEVRWAMRQAATDGGSEGSDAPPEELEELLL